MVKNLRINYNQLLMKKKQRKSEDAETAAEFKKDKHDLVEKCLVLIGDKYMEIALKHDGSRILQALIKFGHREHRTKIVESLKDKYVELACGNYSHYLASKMYYYAPTNEQKTYLRTQLCGSVSKLVSHQYGAEVLEFVYSRCNETE